MADAVTILVRNETAEHFLNIFAYTRTAQARSEEVRFLEDADGDPQGKLFPEAWRVLSLGPHQHSRVRFPLDLRLSVREVAGETGAPLRVTDQDVSLGQVWRFERHPREPRFTRLLRLDEQLGPESAVTLVNAAPQTIDASLTRNGQTLSLQEAIPRGGRVDFTGATALEWCFYSDLSGGARPPDEAVASVRAWDAIPHLLELEGLQRITLAVVVENPVTGRLGWRESDRIMAR